MNQMIRIVTPIHTALCSSSSPACTFTYKAQNRARTAHKPSPAMMRAFNHRTPCSVAS